MKKILFFVIAFAALLALNINASSKECLTDSFDSLSETYTATAKNGASIDVTDGCLVMAFNSEISASPNATMDFSPCNQRGIAFNIEIRAQFSGDNYTKINKRLRILSGDKIIGDALRLQGNSFTFFGADVDFNARDGLFHTYRIEIEPENAMARLKADGVNIAEAACNIPEDFDFTGVIYRLMNTGSSVVGSSEMKIDSFTVAEAEIFIPAAITVTTDKTDYIQGDAVSVIPQIEMNSAEEIACVNYYVNGEYYSKSEEAPFCANINVNYQKSIDIYAVCVDNSDNESKSNVLTVEFSEPEAKQELVEIFGTDFEKGTPKAVSSRNTTNQPAFYNMAANIDEQHGKSIEIGTTSNIPSGIPHLYITTGGVSLKYLFETELYLTSDASYVQMQLIGDNRASTFTIDGGWIKSNVNGKNEYLTELQKNTWYKIKILIDTKNGIYDFSINDKLYIDGQPFEATPVNMSEIRILSNSSVTDIAASCVFDNMKLYAVSDYPMISAVAYDDYTVLCDVVSSAKCVNVLMSGELQASSVSADSVKLFCDGKETPVNKVEYSAKDAMIKIYPKNCLISNQEYNIQLGREIKTIAGSELEQPIEGSFKVAYNDVDVKDCRFSISGNGVICTIDAVNKTDRDQMIYAVATVLNGNRIVKSFAAEQIIPTTGGSIIINIPDVEEEETVSVITVTNLDNPTEAGGRTFLYEC